MGVGGGPRTHVSHRYVKHMKQEALLVLGIYAVLCDMRLIRGLVAIILYYKMKYVERETHSFRLSFKLNM